MITGTYFVFCVCPILSLRTVFRSKPYGQKKNTVPFSFFSIIFNALQIAKEKKNCFTRVAKMHCNPCVNEGKIFSGCIWWWRRRRRLRCHCCTNSINNDLHDTWSCVGRPNKHNRHTKKFFFNNPIAFSSVLFFSHSLWDIYMWKFVWSCTWASSLEANTHYFFYVNFRSRSHSTQIKKKRKISSSPWHNMLNCKQKHRGREHSLFMKEKNTNEGDE